jgi:adenylosuccinate synthase
LFGEEGEMIRKIGDEYGATTGRPRRCGWFDAIIVKRALKTNGINGLAIMKLDVLDSFDTIKVCVGYQAGKKTYTQPPMKLSDYDRYEPIYEEFDGWKTSTRGVTTYEDLPLKAKRYLKILEALVETRIDIISTGPERESNIILNNSFEKR